MISKIVTAGAYNSIVDVQLVRDALNLQDSTPSNGPLIFRIEEAAQRIESLTRLVLAESTWMYELYPDDFDDFLEHGTLPDAIRLAGLFAVGVAATVSITDDDGEAVPINCIVEGMGDSILLRPTDGTFLDYYLPLTIVIVRGVSASQLPGDLRAAIVTQCEQLTDGFSPLAEASIIRSCSGYGWAG